MSRYTRSDAERVIDLDLHKIGNWDLTKILMEARFPNSSKFISKRMEIANEFSVDYPEWDLDQGNAITFTNQERAESAVVFPGRLTVESGMPSDSASFVKRVGSSASKVAKLMTPAQATRIGIRHNWAIDAEQKQAVAIIENTLLGSTKHFGSAIGADVSVTFKSQDMRYYSLSYTIHLVPAVLQSVRIHGEALPETLYRKVLMLDVDVFAENCPLTKAETIAAQSFELVESVILPKFGG